MDIYDHLQDADLRHLRDRLDTLQSWDTETHLALKALVDEVAHTRVRVEALGRLLIAKGLVSAEEYAQLISQVSRKPAEPG